MNAAGTLGIYGVVLGAVLVGTMALGGAADPIGLSNAEPVAAHGGMVAAGEGLPGLASAEGGFRLEPVTELLVAGLPTTFRFSVRGEDGTVTDFDVEHTKRMHLVVVRRDFSGFLHLHPTMAADGTWSTDLTLAEPGTYRAYADFVVDGEKRTLGTDLFVAGDFRPLALPEVSPTADAADGYTVELDGAPVVGEGSVLRFTVRRHGEVVRQLPGYLGARGHLVALRDGDLAYLHVHADEDRLEFEADFPTPGAYRLFLQFRHDGEVRTAAFTVEAEEATR